MVIAISGSHAGLDGIVLDHGAILSVLLGSFWSRKSITREEISSSRDRRGPQAAAGRPNSNILHFIGLAMKCSHRILYQLAVDG
jgi:hypothetical protein